MDTVVYANIISTEHFLVSVYTKIILRLELCLESRAPQTFCLDLGGEKMEKEEQGRNGEGTHGKGKRGRKGGREMG